MIKLLIIVAIMLASCKANKNNSLSVGGSSDTSVIIASGVTSYPENNIYFITPIIGGAIKKIMVPNGAMVKARQPLAILQDPAYLDIQMEYLALRHELDYLREEFKRQGELTVENVASIKKLQMAQSGYLSKEAICLGMEKKLQLMGIDPSKVISEGPRSTITLHAKGPGKVYYAEGLAEGCFAVLEKPVFMIVRSDSLIVTLRMEIVHFNRVSVGDTVEMFLAGNLIAKGNILENSVYLENNYLVCKASVIDQPPFLIAGVALHCIIKPVAMDKKTE